MTACKKNEKETDVSRELEKIETTWDGISQKDEKGTAPKIETVASDKILNEIRARVQQQYNDYIAKAGTNPHTERLGNYVGVIKTSGTPGSDGCNGYDELEINMDCEDNNTKTGWLDIDPYFGGTSPDYTSYRPDGWTIGGNVSLRFCLVPGDNFHPFLESVGGTFGKYAVLRVTTNFLHDAHEVARRFDNEDRRNLNSAYIRRGGQTINVEGVSADNDNSVYRTYIDGNSYLSFHVFHDVRDGGIPPGVTPISDYPDFGGLSYGVFGGSIAPRSLGIGLLKVDDEDNNNANLYFDEESSNQDQINLWFELRDIAEGRNGDLPSVSPGNQDPLPGKDTYVFIARAK
jgi:hypothetical protein